MWCKQRIWSWHHNDSQFSVNMARGMGLREHPYLMGRVWGYTFVFVCIQGSVCAPHAWWRITCPFVRGIHLSSMDSPHNGQWRGVWMFSLICAWTNGWANSRDAGDLRRHRAHYDVTLMGAWLQGYESTSCRHWERDASLHLKGMLGTPVPMPQRYKNASMYPGWVHVPIMGTLDASIYLWGIGTGVPTNHGKVPSTL